jgi:hypothetical protein
MFIRLSPSEQRFGTARFELSPSSVIHDVDVVNLCLPVGLEVRRLSAAAPCAKELVSKDSRRNPPFSVVVSGPGRMLVSYLLHIYLHFFVSPLTRDDARCVQRVQPANFATVATPSAPELVSRRVMDLTKIQCTRLSMVAQ